MHPYPPTPSQNNNEHLRKESPVVTPAIWANILKEHPTNPAEIWGEGKSSPKVRLDRQDSEITHEIQRHEEIRKASRDWVQYGSHRRGGLHVRNLQEDRDARVQPLWGQRVPAQGETAHFQASEICWVPLDLF